MVGILLVI